VTSGEGQGAVDVTRLMEEIKERVRQRRAAGFYSEEEVRRITQMELEVTEVSPGLQEEIEGHLATLNDSWDSLRSPAISSHRGGVGKLIVAAKQLLYRLTKPYLALAFQRQLEFNVATLHLLNAFVLPVRDQIRELGAKLAHKTEELSLTIHERVAAEHVEGLRRHQLLAERVDRLGRELAAVRESVDRAQAGWPSVLPPRPAVPRDLGQLPPEAYLRFEDRHRGTREEIRQRQRAYLDLFSGGPILDVGCGRGEFLELCREVGIEASGIDQDPGMVATCREAGLDVTRAEALSHLDGLPDASLGGVFCSQVIEHLPPDALIALIQLAHAKLRSGGVLICETPNPTCLTVFSGAFYIDLTHIKPIHPEATVFVYEAAGLRDVQIRYANPYPPDMLLQPLEPLWYMRRYEEAFLKQLNDNFARLNATLWGPQDYAVIGRKL
jgi:SAM-dependent methyltransferase